jgi:hypothetical protein
MAARRVSRKEVSNTAKQERPSASMMDAAGLRTPMINVLGVKLKLH